MTTDYMTPEREAEIRHCPAGIDGCNLAYPCGKLAGYIRELLAELDAVREERDNWMDTARIHAKERDAVAHQGLQPL